MGESTALWTHLLTGLGPGRCRRAQRLRPACSGVALLARAHWVTLSPPFDLLAHSWVIAALVFLLLLELVVDKIPVADHVNDVVQTFIRPAAGALLFVGGSGAAGQVPPVVLVIAGLVAAFGVHATKATVRPAVNACIVRRRHAAGECCRGRGRRRDHPGGGLRPGAGPAAAVLLWRWRCVVPPPGEE